MSHWHFLIFCFGSQLGEGAIQDRQKRVRIPVEMLIDVSTKTGSFEEPDLTWTITGAINTGVRGMQGYTGLVKKTGEGWVGERMGGGWGGGRNGRDRI